jgi:hypothetical protein
VGRLIVDCDASGAPLVRKRPTAIFISGSCRSRRDASRIRHEMFEMVMARVSAAHFGLAHRPSTMALQSAAAGHGIPRLRNVLMALSVGAFGQ